MMKKILFVIIGGIIIANFGYLLTFKFSTSFDSSILIAVSKAVKFLESSQRENGAICEKTSSVFDVWETINSLYALSLWSDEINYNMQPILKKALQFLKSAENPDGMVLHNHNHRGKYCVETSSEYIRLLLRIYSPTIPQKVYKKLEFLKNQQMPSGHWKIVNPAVPPDLQEFPSVTAFALRVLQLAGTKPNYEEAAFKFLIRSQNQEGHWGVAWEYYGTPFYAMVPILYVLTHDDNFNKYKYPIEKSKKYLLKTQNDDGSWFYKLEGFSNLPSPEL